MCHVWFSLKDSMIDCWGYLLMFVLCSSCRCIIAESWMNWINRPWVSALFVIAKCVDIQVILLLERCSFYRSDDPLIKNNWGSGRQFDPPKVVSATQIQRTTLLPRLPHTCLLLLWHASDMFLPSRFLFFFMDKNAYPSCLLGIVKYFCTLEALSITSTTYEKVKISRWQYW